MAEVVRAGDDVTVVATQAMRHAAVAAADELAKEGISIEVIDPRTLVPFDLETVASSLAHTNRLVVVQETCHAGSWGATLVSAVTQAHFGALHAPPVVVSAEDTPIPYSRNLEDAWLPSAGRIAEALRTTAAF